MRRFTLLLLALFVTLFAGCATATPTIVPTPSPAAPKPTIRFSYPASPGLVDVPFFMALDKLRADGYTVETTQFARFELNLAALAKGDLDIASGSLQPAWAAIAKGAPMRSIVIRQRNADLLVARSDLETCADLANKNVALSSATSTAAILLNEYIAKHCPGTTYTSVMIATSSNRVPAVLNGSVDAANLQLDDLLQIEHEAPGRFHALIRFADEYPNIQNFAFHARQDFSTQHPEAVRAFIRALLQAQREIQNKQVLRAAASKYLTPDSPTMDDAVTAYIDGKMWDANGTLTTENVQATLDFFIGANSLPAELKPADVADLSFLNAVLDEIGRQ